MGHFTEIVRHRIIADLVVQAEHEDYGVNPSRKLQQKINVISFITILPNKPDKNIPF